MGLLLCTPRAEQPFYYEKLDRKLWSIQELCYILYRYPVVIPEDFVDAKLCQWLSQIGLQRLSERLLQFLQMGEEQDRLILRILREGNYYTEREIQDFGLSLRRLREIEHGARQEMLGDTYFRMGRYGRAVEAYRSAVSERRGGRVREKLADSLVTVMQLRRAAGLYEDVYRESGETEALRKLYFLEKLEPALKVFAPYRERVTAELLSDWEKCYEEALQSAGHSEPAEEIRRSYARGEAAFRADAAGTLREWKRAYREKV
ncbi:hypothetical protein HW273_08260 [Oribacterium sp. oral taxon 102]|uniref:hypothetical protein n=1 Tax=Oribacterium sp. oral taxon 102 TaxID=671214 RepID=UPI0015BC9044|nr:hypothetical protein [Oribacterium sp. oral taxon 102]NWO21890.1 hypothetical protein [Oribacterium sp. oral taxon 102]